MKRNIKAEKKQMAEEISIRLGWGTNSPIQKSIAKDLQKLSHFTLFTLRAPIIHKGKAGSKG